MKWTLEVSDNYGGVRTIRCNKACVRDDGGLFYEDPNSGEQIWLATGTWYRAVRHPQ